MPGKHPYKDVIKIRERRGKKSFDKEIDRWRAKWRKLGPVRFAEEVLICWPENPIHPELGRLPKYVLLSEDQKKFLTDLWKRGFPGYILIGARGSGKTYILAVYECWRLCCFNYWTMTHLGGSAGQSIKGKRYIDFWRNNVNEIYYSLPKSVESVAPLPPHIESRWGAVCYYPACSEASARNPHVRELHIDEVSTGEHRSKEGRRAIEAAQYQITTSPDPMLGWISTAQYSTGSFVKIWKDYKRLRYKRYRWNLARHISPKWYKKNGRPDWDYIDSELYRDQTPSNWISSVWWETTENIQNLRRKSSNDQWLVEILGGISKGSGLVFSRADLEACICTGKDWTEDGKECRDCYPYTDKCPMMKKKDLKPNMISNRYGGADFGDISPNALTIVGQRQGKIYVLYSDERTGMRTDEIIEWISGKLKEYSVWTIFCDPEERAMGDALENDGYSTPNPWKMGGGLKKRVYLKRTERFMEQHKLFIPWKFQYLIDSINGLSYDGRGGVIKSNDHSFDSLLYSLIDYDPDYDSGGMLKEIKDKTIKIW